MARLAGEVEALAAAGVRGLALGGPQSEWTRCSESDFDAGLRCLAHCAAAARLPFVAGATHPDLARERTRVETAGAHGPGAIRVGLPAPTDMATEEVVRYLSSIAETAAPAGLVLDLAQEHVAGFDIAHLVEACPFIVGLSLMDFDESACRRLVAIDDELAVLVPGPFLATGFRHGARGSFSRLALLSPAGAQVWNEDLVDDLEAALTLELRVQRFLEDWIAPYTTRRGFSPAAVDKLLVEIGGWCPLGMRVHSPHVAIDGAEAERLLPLARERLPEFFAD